MKAGSSVMMLMLLAGGIVIGIVGLSTFSIKLAVLYTLLTALALLVIIYSYCAKCTCRLQGCSCVFPGKLTRYLRERKPEKYSRLDLTGVMAGFSIITLFPQYWLFQNKLLLFLFWIVLSLAHVHIRLFVCRGCQNLNCPALPGRKK